MDVILKEGIDLLNEIGAKQSTSEEILSKLGQGVTANAVKSVQRGKFDGNTTDKYVTNFLPNSNTAYTKTYYLDITIDEVNVNKCSVSCETRSGSFNLCELLNSTTLRLYVGEGTNASSNTSYSGGIWEIVEYY